MPVEGIPGDPGSPADGAPFGPGVPAEPGAPGIPGNPNGAGIAGTWVPRTDTSTSNPSSPSSDVLLASPELDDEEPFGGPPVGIDPGLPWDEAVDPALELLEAGLDRDADGMEGEPELDELDADGMDGELGLERDEEAEGIEGEELLELDEDEAVGIEGEELELLWLVSVLHAARSRHKADAVIKAFVMGNRVTGLFMFCPCRVHDFCTPSPDVDRAGYTLISGGAGQHPLDQSGP